MAAKKKSYPLCFASRLQYEVWKKAAKQCRAGDSSYCVDCTLAYQREMVTSFRCAHPCTSFHRDSDGFLEGRRRMEDRVQLREAA